MPRFIFGECDVCARKSIIQPCHLNQFDSKNWNSFFACVHCRHSNLPFYNIEKQRFLFLSWDHLKPAHSNVNLVLQWNYIWLMIMFNQTWVGHKCLVNLSTYTFCFCQALIYNLFCFKLQSWTGGQIRRLRKLSRPCSLKVREKWLLSCDHSLLLQVATEPCDKPISALSIYLNFAAT